MTNYISRAEWGARAPRGIVALVERQVEGIALHWPGHPTPIAFDRIDDALRGWQNDHMDDPDKHWADIAYQAAVDHWGRAWDLRGLGTKSAANGDQDVNERFGAVLLIVATNEEPSPAMIATTRDVIRDFRTLFPNGTEIEPHSAVRPAGTDCPGPAVQNLIAIGVFEPTQQEEPEMTPEQFAAHMDVQNKILTEVRGINARIGYVANEGMQDVDEIRDKIVGTPE